MFVILLVSIYRSEQGLELDLFLLQCCGAVAPADSYVNKLLSRFGLSSYLSLNSDITNEYVTIVLLPLVDPRTCLIAMQHSNGQVISYNMTLFI